MKSFRQAKPYIFIDDAVLNKSLDYLTSQLKDNGAFTENGEVHDKNMQVRLKVKFHAIFIMTYDCFRAVLVKITSH